MRVAAAVILAACVGMIAGCGNTYRPVLATIGAVGPAAQPQKYAVAVSTPTQTPAGGPITFVGVWSSTTTYSINQGVTYLGSQYVSLKNGNLNQVPSNASTSWSLLTNGLLTMVDFSGDTVLVTATLGVNPYYFVLSAQGTTGYTLNSDKTLNSFDVSTSLISSQILESTLLSGANPISIFPTNQSTYISDPGVNAVDQLTSTPPALKQELPIAGGYSPLYVVGNSSSARAYAITPSTTGGPGQVSAIETGGNTISTTLPVGRGPVYGVMSLDNRRAFILNQTDGTVSVINAQTNLLDTPINTITVGPQPVWADLASGLDELVVVNEGNGTTAPGSVTIINIPLCSVTALPTNPNCNATNPIDATNFGQVVATIPVGINPIQVTVLSDYTRAYVANAGNPALPCAANGVAVAGVSTTCTVSVINLLSNTVTATIPINGHPVYIAATNSTPTGKVYVVCKDSQVMTVIETDTDSLDTTIPLQGYGVSVRVTQR
jgi:YVTN family beta-propeller protein